MASSENALHGKRLLLIEPSEASRSRMKIHFEGRGMIVYSAGKLEKLQTIIEGSKANRTPFHVILVDVRLPECYDFFALR